MTQQARQEPSTRGSQLSVNDVWRTVPSFQHKHGSHCLGFLVAHWATLLLDVWVAGHWDPDLGPWLSTVLTPILGLVASCGWCVAVWSITGTFLLRGPTLWLAGLGGAGSALVAIFGIKLGIESPLIPLLVVPAGFGVASALISGCFGSCLSAKPCAGPQHDAAADDRPQAGDRG